MTFVGMIFLQIMPEARDDGAGSYGVVATEDQRNLKRHDSWTESQRLRRASFQQARGRQSRPTSKNSIVSEIPRFFFPTILVDKTSDHDHELEEA